MNLVAHLQWPAMAVGVVGAWLVGSQHPTSRLAGFIGFLLSNLLWIVWGMDTAAWGLVAMQAVFILTSLRGIVSNGKAWRAVRA